MARESPPPNGPEWSHITRIRVSETCSNWDQLGIELILEVQGSDKVAGFFG